MEAKNLEKIRIDLLVNDLDSGKFTWKKDKNGLYEKIDTIEPPFKERNINSLEIIENIRKSLNKKILREKKPNRVSRNDAIKNAIKMAGITKEELESTSKDSLKSFLIDNRPKFESLGCGYHKNVFYFGTRLYKDGLGFDSVITSDKKVYINKSKNNEVRNIFDLNYREDFFDESLDNIFSKDFIQKWIYGDCSDITLETVYERLINIFKRYIYFSDTRVYSVLACYRIAGFFMPIWKTRARLFIFADPGSSKSRLTQILHNTGFNSIALGDWTLPYLRAIIESTRGETHIDDFETLDEEKQKATIRLIKVGYMKGFKAGKMSDGKIRRPEVNDLFNTTTINNTTGLDFISGDRCITIRIPKISKAEFNQEPDFNDKIWKEIIGELYICGLKYPTQVQDNYKCLISNDLNGRLFSIIKPELTIAKMISEQIYNDVEEFWKSEIEQRKCVNYDSDWEFLAYKEFMIKLLDDRNSLKKALSTLPTPTTLSTLSTLSTKKDYYIPFKEIINPIVNTLYGGLESNDFKKKKASISITVGNMLSRNPIWNKREVRGVKEYQVDFNEFLSLLYAKGYLKVILEMILGEEVKVECVDSVGCRQSETYKETEKIKKFKALIDYQGIVISEHGDCMDIECGETYTLKKDSVVKVLVENKMLEELSDGE